MTPTNVLFMQSQSYFGSDSMIHSLIMQNLDPERFTVHVACNAGPRGQRPSAALKALSGLPGVRVKPMNFGTTINFRSQRQIVTDTLAEGPHAAWDLAGLVRYARRNHIKIVHCTEKPRDAFYGYLLSRAIGAKCIIHLHVGVNPEWMLPLTQWAMKRADGLIGVSDFVAESAVKTGHDPDRVFSVVNAIDPSGWDPTTDGRAVRAEFGIPDGVPVVSIISRVCPWKGHTQLLEALAKVRAEIGDFRLLLVGEDDIRATPGHHSYLGELRELTAELGLEDVVVFTGFRRDIPEIMAASDVYAMPSYEEPCAVAFLEAMAMAKPVIALDSGGTAHMVEHGGSGLLSTPYDVDELAANLKTMLGDPALRLRMGQRGRQLVEDELTPARLGRDVAAVYDEVLRRA